MLDLPQNRSCWLLTAFSKTVVKNKLNLTQLKFCSGISATNSMEQRPSSEANSRSAGQEIVCLL
jgi:hypothetical protein